MNLVSVCRKYSVLRQNYDYSVWSIRFWGFFPLQNVKVGGYGLCVAGSLLPANTLFAPKGLSITKRGTTLTYLVDDGILAQPWRTLGLILPTVLDLLALHSTSGNKQQKGTSRDNCQICFDRLLLITGLHILNILSTFTSHVALVSVHPMNLLHLYPKLGNGEFCSKSTANFCW